LCEEKLRIHVEIHYSDDDRSEFEIRKGGASIARGLIVIDFGRASREKLFRFFPSLGKNSNISLAMAKLMRKFMK
jgi:hypothetical protein